MSNCASHWGIIQDNTTQWSMMMKNNARYHKTSQDIDKFVDIMPNMSI